MRSLVLFSALALAGCAGPTSSMEPPIVDQRGVSQEKFAQDQAECIQKGNVAFALGAPVTNCMRERGYTILVPKS